MNYSKLYLYAIGVFLFVSCSQTTNAEKQETKIVGQEEETQKSLQLQIANVSIEVVPGYGGRISKLSCDGTKLLMDDSNGNFSFGSTFWLAPQSLWGWPPPEKIDLAPYKVVKNNAATISLMGQLDPVMGVKVGKEITVQEDTSISITYTVKNETDSTIQVAPWEISRVPKKGLTFFPQGENNPRPKVAEKKMPIFKLKDGIFYYKCNAKEDTAEVGRLMIANGSEGWSAFVHKNVLWVKKFEDMAPEDMVDGEDEILHYVSPLSESFQEFEIEGKYHSIPAGESIQWNVTWILRTVEKKDKLANYVALARKLVQ